MKNNVNMNNTINWAKYFEAVICFMLLINFMFLMQGLFFSPNGYSFDIQKHVFSQLPIALICGAFGMGVREMGRFYER